MRHLLCSSAAVALSIAAMTAVPATPAQAAVYISQLEYRDGLVGAQTPAYGTVTITELNPDSVRVEVDFTNANTLFINTGGPHNPFVFNTLHADQVTTPVPAATDDPNAITMLPPVGNFFDAGRGSFDNTPFGNFTNEIALNAGNGQVNGQQDPMIFTVNDPNGITFAGIGATFSSTGLVLTTGTGDHFFSTTGGWWFSADIYDGATGGTYNVAARDAFLQMGVPEPATWGLMIMGIGGLGAVLRRRRTAPALA